MKTHQFVLRNFAPEDGHWMVKGVGRILKAPNNQSFKSAEIILGKVVYGKQSKSMFKSCSEQEICSHQNLSNLPLLVPGSIWESQNLTSKMIGLSNRANKRLQFSVDSEATFVTLRQVLSDNELSVFGFGQKSAESTYLSISRPSQPHYLLIPCAEILRVDYGSSPNLIQAAIGGWIEFAPERFVNEVKSTAVSKIGYLHPPFIHFVRGVSWKKDTLATLASMYFDEYCRSVQASAYSSVIQSANAKKGTANFSIKPLSNKSITMEAIVEEQSLYMHEAVDAKRYIVRKIIYWDAPLPISSFNYRFDGDNRKADVFGPLKPFRFPKRKQRKRELDIDPTEVQSESQADANKYPQHIKILGPVKPNIDRINCEKLAKLEQTHEWDKTPPKEHADNGGSTGEKAYQDDLAPEVLFETNELDEAQQHTPQNLRVFSEAVVLLRASLASQSKFDNVSLHSIHHEGGWRAQTPINDTEFWINPFPAKVGGVDSSSFAYTSRAPEEVARTYMMIELKIDDATFVLIETERLDDDKIPTFIVCKKAFTSLIPHEFKLLIGCMAISKSSLFPRHSLAHMFRQRVNHIQTDTALSLGDRLHDYIVNAVCLGEGRLTIPPNVSIEEVTNRAGNAQ